MSLSQKKRDLFIYRLLDLISAASAWSCFFIFRKMIESENLHWDTLLSDDNFFYGLFLIPVWWLLLYYVFDNYKDIYRLSRISTLIRTFIISFIGVVILYFTILTDDFTLEYISSFHSFSILFSLHLGITATLRMLWLTRASKRLKKGLVSYNTIIIGGNQKAKEMYMDIYSRPYQLGHSFLGYVDSNSNQVQELGEDLPCLGKIMDLRDLIQRHKVEEVIVAIETSDHKKIRTILNILFEFRDNLLIKIIPDMYDIMLGSVKMNHVYGAVLIEIEHFLMPHWQKLFKRGIDIIISIFLLILLLPFNVYIAIKVRLSSPGEIIFKQERIGRNGQPFQIFKFRSMVQNAEEDGPQLSYESDARCTHWGAIMRKWRIDEIPQLINVLKGEMSLVGPRPERAFYIEQILKIAPHYKQLLKVRPGITSWGQVKFGYASNLEQMLKRMKFDILYLENMSLALDFKILFYTVLVVIQGKGK